MERKEEKFCKNIISIGGISYYGLCNLIIVEDTMNEFAYAPEILLYKKNIKELKKIRTKFLNRIKLLAKQVKQIKNY